MSDQTDAEIIRLREALDNWPGPLTRWQRVVRRWHLFWLRWRCEHNVHPDHAKGWVCIKCGKTMWL